MTSTNNLFIVDDNENNRDMLARRLERKRAEGGGQEIGIDGGGPREIDPPLPPP